MSLISAGDFSVAWSQPSSIPSFFVSLPLSIFFHFPFNSFPLEVKAESPGVSGAGVQPGEWRLPGDGMGWEHTRVAPSHVPQAPQEEQPGGFM